jgi:hypothetical protein
MAKGPVHARKLTAAQKIAILDAPGFLEIQRARAALRLLEVVDGDHLPPGTDSETEAWIRGIAKDTIAENLNTAEKKISAAAEEKAGGKTRA